MADLRKLAGLQLAVACVVAALAGLPARQPAGPPAFEASRPASSPDWGSRSAPSDVRIEKGQLGGGSLKSGFQSSASLTRNAASTVPAGATILARSASDSFLDDRFAGPHSGRSPPRNA